MASTTLLDELEEVADDRPLSFGVAQFRVRGGRWHTSVEKGAPQMKQQMPTVYAREAGHGAPAELVGLSG